MRTIKFVLIAAVVVLGVVAGWQTASHVLANFQLQDDMHDMASQLGSRIGFNPPRSDDDYRTLVVRKAGEYGIELKPEQVAVRRSENTDAAAKIELAADYNATVKLPGYSFELHFMPSSTKKNLF
jgi:ABC-type sugar transport system substrate-binding protein